MVSGRKTLNGQGKEGEQGFVGERMWMKEEPMRGWQRGSTKVYDRDKLFRVQEGEVKNDDQKRYKDEEYNVTTMRKTFGTTPFRTESELWINGAALLLVLWNGFDL